MKFAAGQTCACNSMTKEEDVCDKEYKGALNRQLSSGEEQHVHVPIN